MTPIAPHPDDRADHIVIAVCPTIDGYCDGATNRPDPVVPPGNSQASRCYGGHVGLVDQATSPEVDRDAS
jgi:hypothetical protein